MMEKTEAVEAIVTIFKNQAERLEILRERTDLLLDNQKTTTECIALLAQRIVMLEDQVATLMKFIVTGLELIATPTDDKDVH